MRTRCSSTLWRYGLLTLDAAALEREKPALNSHRRVAALTAAVVFAVHPLRVEPVAWASAFPYILSLTLLLLAFLSYFNYAATKSPSAGWLVLSIGAYVASCLARASAIGFPFLLLLVDCYPLRRRVTRRLLFEKLPFLIVATAFAFAEWHARDIVSLQEVGLGARMTMAAVAPFIYLGRTLASRVDLAARSAAHFTRARTRPACRWLRGAGGGDPRVVDGP